MIGETGRLGPGERTTTSFTIQTTSPPRFLKSGLWEIFAEPSELLKLSHALTSLISQGLLKTDGRTPGGVAQMEQLSMMTTPSCTAITIRIRHEDSTTHTILYGCTDLEISTSGMQTLQLNNGPAPGQWKISVADSQSSTPSSTSDSPQYLTKEEARQYLAQSNAFRAKSIEESAARQTSKTPDAYNGRTDAD